MRKTKTRPKLRTKKITPALPETWDKDFGTSARLSMVAAVNASGHVKDVTALMIGGMEPFFVAACVEQMAGKMRPETRMELIALAQRIEFYGKRHMQKIGPRNHCKYNFEKD